ncbi:hypothetical protein PO587_02760 [Streptomyces gilvifuscus]|uniref:Uncharacterized protein n=1 Tax=Streptomyces gilvifuscus TaxID=1550617 RepID=A0ABT5FLM4_9ACTN|nr:hypothetical protein [Streptomyces gilvifuscus]MDC2953372.1 hypothetical protein [Streptomyces gilvifuscus]
MSDDPYAEDRAVVAQELTDAQELDFNEYVGFMAEYGIRLRELSRKHEDPETAYRHLLKYSDDFLESLNGQS